MFQTLVLIGAAFGFLLIVLFRRSIDELHTPGRRNLLRYIVMGEYRSATNPELVKLAGRLRLLLIGELLLIVVLLVSFSLRLG